MQSETVLIFRIGSLGDTIVSLPCFHLIARSFPNARRILVTDIPASQKVAPVESVLGRGDLIHDVIYFPPPPRRLKEILALRNRIRQTGAQTLIHIADRKLGAVLRDRLFFVGSGVRRIVGAPVAGRIRNLRVNPLTGETEHEAERLARCLRPLGEIDLSDGAQWDLHLSDDERAAADEALAPLHGRPFIAASMSAKIKQKDWGVENWQDLLRLLAPNLSHMGLVFFGVANEAERSAMLAQQWRGPSLNLCGRLAPRESAAGIAKASLFIGHDSGPLHLAAAVGVTCVGIYGRYNQPKRWHPIGERHFIIHRPVDVRAIAPQEVHDLVVQAMYRLSAAAELRPTAN